MERGRVGITLVLLRNIAAQFPGFAPNISREAVGKT